MSQSQTKGILPLLQQNSSPVDGSNTSVSNESGQPTPSWEAFDIIILAIVFVALTGLWFWSQYAKVDQLKWILQPTIWIVTGALDMAFHFVSGKGFVNANGSIIVDTSCAGVVFLVISSSLTWSQLLPFPRQPRRPVVYILIGILGPYLTTILANSSRIIVSIRMKPLRIPERLSISPESIHLLTGMLVYLFALVLFFLGLKKVLHVLQRKS